MDVIYKKWKCGVNELADDIGKELNHVTGRQMLTMPNIKILKDYVFKVRGDIGIHCDIEKVESYVGNSGYNIETHMFVSIIRCWFLATSKNGNREKHMNAIRRAVEKYICNTVDVSCWDRIGVCESQDYIGRDLALMVSELMYADIQMTFCKGTGVAWYLRFDDIERIVVSHDRLVQKLIRLYVKCEKAKVSKSEIISHVDSLLFEHISFQTTRHFTPLTAEDIFKLSHMVHEDIFKLMTPIIDEIKEKVVG